MARTFYCAQCLNSFQQDGEICPNLGCGADRPDLGWGHLLGPRDLLDRRYRVRERLAVGGAGITYRAREVGDDEEELGPELAIKVLFQRGDGTWLRRLGNEARVLQELAHPHIVESRGFVHRTGHPAYLVTTYEAGGNLYDHVRHVGALTLAASLGVFRQVLQALSVAHARGVIHRDLKPQNLFLRAVVDRSETPHILVADFGIAKVQGFMGDHLTTTGMFVGTPEFAAPEQFKGLPPEPPSDVFAAACVFWFCLTGSPPVPLVDRTDLVASLRALRAGLPPVLPPGVCTEAERAPLEDLIALTLTNEAPTRATIPALLARLEAFDTAPIGPLDRSPMMTLAPDALMPMDDTTLDPALLQDPTTTHETPLPPADVVPVVVPVAAATPPVEASSPPPTPPRPVDAPPAAPKPTPARRMRLGKHEDHRPTPQAATPRSQDEGLDALFDAPADDAGHVAVPTPSRDEVSLDDLFAPPPVAVAPPPVATEPPKEEPVLDAFWETVAEAPLAEVPSGQAPMEGAPVSSPSVAPTPALPVAAAPAWVPASPQAGLTAASDTERLDALGRCSPRERDALFAAIDTPSAAVKALGAAPSVATLCGAALTVARFELKPSANWARQLLSHAEPAVRACAALAVGAVGAPGQLALLNRLLTDADADVRLAAVHGLKTLGERTGRQEMVASWLSAVAGDADERVKAAAR